MRSCRAKARFVSGGAAKTEGLRGAWRLSRRPSERRATEVATWEAGETFGRRAAAPNAIARDARFAAPTGSWSAPPGAFARQLRFLGLAFDLIDVKPPVVYLTPKCVRTTRSR